VSKERYCDYLHKYTRKFGTLKVKTNRSKFSLFELLWLWKKSISKVKFCNPDIGTNCWRETSTSILHRGNHS